jgi:C-terminal processing protease CtpA/Prc
MSKDKSLHKNGIIPDIEIIEDVNLSNLKSGKMIDKAIEILK